MNSFFSLRAPITTVSNFVVVSELGTTFTGRWPTEAAAWDFCVSLGRGASIVPCEPYEVTR